MSEIITKIGIDVITNYSKDYTDKIIKYVSSKGLKLNEDINIENLLMNFKKNHVDNNTNQKIDFEALYNYISSSEFYDDIYKCLLNEKSSDYLISRAETKFRANDDYVKEFVESIIKLVENLFRKTIDVKDLYLNQTLINETNKVGDNLSREMNLIKTKNNDNRDTILKKIDKVLENIDVQEIKKVNNDYLNENGICDANLLKLDFSISFLQENIDIDVTTNEWLNIAFSTEYLNCKVDDITVTTKNRLMKWYVGDRNEQIVVSLVDKRIDFLKSKIFEIEKKIEKDVNLNIQEECIYENINRLIRTFENQRKIKEQAIIAYLKENIFQAYCNVGIYKDLLEFIKKILFYQFQCSKWNLTDTSVKFKTYDVYTEGVPSKYHEHFLVFLEREKVEKSYINYPGGYVIDCGDIEVIKDIAVQYYIEYIGKGIVDYKIDQLKENFFESKKKYIHFWNIGPH